MSYRKVLGKFIAIEGIDGSGKETISKMLAENLRAIRFSFPDYGTPTGKLIREHLQGKWWTTDLRQKSSDKSRDALIFQALQTLNRLEHASTIQKYWRMWITIVADRYLVSSLAYGSSDGLDIDYLHQIQSFLPQPDFNFLLDIPVEESFRRRPNRGGDRYEEDRAKLEDVRQRYREIFAERSNNDTSGAKWIILDGTQSPQEILKEILDIVYGG